MDLEALKNNPDKIKQLIGLLSSLLDSNEEEPEPEPDKIKTKNKKARRNTKKSKNLFDTMSIKDSHKQDTEIDKILNKNKTPSERSREFSFIDVKCRQCGEEERVNPSLVYDPKRYRCNSCSTGAGN